MRLSVASNQRNTLELACFKRLLLCCSPL